MVQEEIKYWGRHMFLKFRISINWILLMGFPRQSLDDKYIH